MVAWYNQGDQDIYEGGQHFMPQSKYLRTAPTFNTPNVEEVITESGIPATDAFQNSGGGGGGGGNLGGDFGNLDLSNTKTFTKNVWDGTEWVSDKVHGFWNPTLGNWQTEQGKNINHGGWFTGDPKKGDIEGTFTHGWDSGKGKIKEGWEEEKDKWAGITGINKAKTFFKNKKEQKLQDEILAHNVAAADEIGATGPQWHTSKGGQDQPGAGGQNVKSSSGDTYGGEAAGYNEAAEKSDYYAKGGRIGYFFGGRTGFAEGGWTPGAGRDESGYQSDHGSYSGGDNNGGDKKNNILKNNYLDVKTDIVKTDPSINFNLKSPLDIAKLRATIGNRNLLDNDDLAVEGDFTTNIGPVDTTTAFTEQGVGNTDINWNNFSATINPNKNIKNIGYNNTWNGIDYGVNYGNGDTMFTVGTNFANGGLAGLL